MNGFEIGRLCDALDDVMQAVSKLEEVEALRVLRAAAVLYGFDVPNQEGKGDTE